jgi:hypothetical protein
VPSLDDDLAAFLSIIMPTVAKSAPNEEQHCEGRGGAREAAAPAAAVGKPHALP